MHDPRTADLEEVVAALKQGETLVLDTLPPEHDELRHIPGAKNACVFDLTSLDVRLVLE